MSAKTLDAYEEQESIEIVKHHVNLMTLEQVLCLIWSTGKVALCCGATSKMVLFMAVADSRVRENERGIVHDI